MLSINLHKVYIHIVRLWSKEAGKAKIPTVATSMSDLSSLFLYLSLGLIILWTMRLAHSKGRNPFVWGGISLLLVLIPSWPDLLGMGPMLVLLFIKSPQTISQETVPETVTCPKCQAYHAVGHTYCVNCGWELVRSYTDDLGHVSEVVTATQAKPEPAPTSEQIEQMAGQSTQHFASEMTSPPYEPLNESLISENVAAFAQTLPEPESEVEQPVVRYPITPAGFTERGLALIAVEQFQGAIDQFTKAIALDPGYVPAWTRRAEAYELMGRQGKAEGDRRHLGGLQGEVTN